MGNKTDIWVDKMTLVWGAPAFPTLAIETIGLGLGLGIGLGIGLVRVRDRVMDRVRVRVRDSGCRNSGCRNNVRVSELRYVPVSTTLQRVCVV